MVNALRQSRAVPLAALAAILAGCGRTDRAADTAPPDTARATTGAASPRPDTSGYVARGACPFECCVYGEWRALTAARLRSAPGAGDSIGTLAANTRFRADSGLVVVNPIGLAVVDQAPARGVFEDTTNLRPGDTLELLDYVGEGFRNVRVRGRRLQLMEYWSAETDAQHGIRMIRAPRSRWWVHATTDAHRGWILMDSVRVRGADRCAGPEPL